MTRPLHDWKAEHTVTLLEPELEWEGADYPISASDIGMAKPRERALRDPCLLDTPAGVFMIYAGAGRICPWYCCPVWHMIMILEYDHVSRN